MGSREARASPGTRAPACERRAQALRIKKDNWSQLLKFFRKAGIADVITPSEVNQIIHCAAPSAAGGPARARPTARPTRASA